MNDTLYDYRDFDDDAKHFFNLANRLCELYISYRERFVIMSKGSVFIPKSNGVPIKLRNSDVCHHLNQRYAISIFAGKYSSKFICFDVDAGGLDAVNEVINRIVAFGIPREYIVVSSSGGKGYHVEVFFDDLVYTDNLAILYDYVIITGGLDATKIEFRPTRNQAIKLPLSVHYKTGNVCWYLDPDTFKPIETMDYLFEIKQFPRSQFVSLIQQCGIRKAITDSHYEEIVEMIRPDSAQEKEVSPDTDSMLYESIYPRITGSGQRHRLMMSIAINARSMEMDQEAIYSTIEKWWNEQDKSLSSTSDAEALRDAAELAEWVSSESFHPVKRRVRLSVDREMMDIVLAQSSRISRRIMFLIAGYCSMFRRIKMSNERIAKFAGCSLMTAHTTLEKMVKSGWIVRSRGRAISDGGGYKRAPNIYRVSEDAGRKAAEILADKGIPDDRYLVQLPFVIEADEDGYMGKQIVPQMTVGEFPMFYRQMMLGVKSPVLRKCTTKLEYREICSATQSPEISFDDECA